ncbi:ArsR family transcriptional regulator [Sinomicrobium kalidii]|uniref:ArsR/SmtB family transcription factor n=1 Tax=Sinomicrobium kalidii TaxID=2900738 RepID=UPI001E343EFE|nr:helix-turn-helix transcriptional regulator [Sinomicrobium kalidii]UGU18217.1 ArsR family transcriptional regulator [Sinomicrobium kalidii]
MDIVEISKVLSNKARVDILTWLKHPEEHFPPHRELGHFNDGVCVDHIRRKTGLSQSTVSHYLNMMYKAGLIEPTRYGKWTYFKRNEETLNAYRKEIENI